MTGETEPGRRAASGAEDALRATPRAVTARPLPPAPPSPQIIPFRRTLACGMASLTLWLTQGMAMNLIAVNLPQIQGSLGGSLAETSWLSAAYMAPNVSMSIILAKVRTQYGLRRFTEISLTLFVCVAFLHLWVSELRSAIPIRFLAGIVASPLSTLGFLYMLDAFPPARKMTWGLSLGATCTMLATPLTRLVSGPLLDYAQWHGLYRAEVGMALIALATVFLVPLTPVPHAKVLKWMDFVSYGMIATGLGLLTIVATMGRYYWWLDTPWLGISLAIGLAFLTLAAVTELNRADPLLNMRWLLTPEMLHLTAVLFAFRFLLSDQNALLTSFIQARGFMNGQTAGLQLIILTCTIGGGVLSALILHPTRVPPIHTAALVMIGCGAWLDSLGTNLTTPAQMYVSQALVAFGAGLFLPASLLQGLGLTLKQGPGFIVSFIAVFLVTQIFGGVLGGAFFGTFIVFRQNFHFQHLLESITLANPQVVASIGQYASAYRPFVSDPAVLNAQGISVLGQQVLTESSVLAYNDAFRLTAWLAFAAIGLLILHLLVLKALSWRAVPGTATA